MIELYQAAFSPVNIAYSILLIFILLYWIVVLLGIIDLDALDFDVGGDVGLDVGGGLDVDAGVDVDGDLAPDVGVAGGFSMLTFLNVGEVPLMFYASIVGLSMWVVSIQLNAYLANDRLWVAALLFIPNLVFSLLLAKFLVLPAKRLRTRPDPLTQLEGKMCLVKSSEVTERYGQCEIATGESPLLLNTRTQNGEKLIKGDAAEVVKYMRQQNVYIVTKHEREI